MNLIDALYDKLIQDGLISAENLEKVKVESQNSGISVEDILARKKIVESESFARAKSEIFKIPYVNLEGKSIDPEIFNFLPSDVIKNYKIIPFDKSSKIISMGMVNPQNLQAIESIEFLAKKNRLKIKYFIISQKNFDDTIKKYESIGVEVKEALGRARSISGAHVMKKEKKESIGEVIRGAPISKIVSVIIRHAVEGGASDIHIEPGEKNTRVRYRVDGILHTSLILPIYVHDSIVSRIKVISNLKIDETRIPQDGRIRLNIGNRQVDFRVSALPLMGKEKIVMRILDTSGGVLTLQDLGFNKKHILILEHSIKISHGMILVTGPTGSGKSTTLYSLLNMLNKEGVNIITLEDPVEYHLDGVNQSQIRQEVGFTFSAGLRSILRQDPDIIMVGEIRDNETAELAIHAGLTGHIVLSTLHTNSAFGAIPRLKDMKVEPFLLGSTLNIVIAQRLVRKLCSFCKKKVSLPPNLEQEILEILNQTPDVYIKAFGIKIDKNKILAKDLVFYGAEGCSKCGGIGYHSRAVIAEILVMTDNLRKLIANNGNEDKIKEELNDQKMITMKQDGILKALSGVTTLEEIMKASKD
ncbi:MAG: ATPase, T2SS/T4P/T4SS family [Patescibacteria group bacterium]|nr:ATPase, T2SS/T4P/T4SS family [Patescibacteria group bacterium]